MEKWEIEKIEQLSPEEGKRFLNELKEKCAQSIKELKEKKKETDSSVAKTLGVISMLLVAAVGIFAGPAMVVLGEGAALGVAGGITAILSMLGFPGGIVLANNMDYKHESVKEGLSVSKELKSQIASLKKKIKDIDARKNVARR